MTKYKSIILLNIVLCGCIFHWGTRGAWNAIPYLLLTLWGFCSFLQFGVSFTHQPLRASLQVLIVGGALMSFSVVFIKRNMVVTWLVMVNNIVEWCDTLKCSLLIGDVSECCEPGQLWVSDRKRNKDWRALRLVMLWSKYKCVKETITPTTKQRKSRGLGIWDEDGFGIRYQSKFKSRLLLLLFSSLFLKKIKNDFWIILILNNILRLCCKIIEHKLGHYIMFLSYIKIYNII